MQLKMTILDKAVQRTKCCCQEETGLGMRLTGSNEEEDDAHGNHEPPDVVDGPSTAAAQKYVGITSIWKDSHDDPKGTCAWHLCGMTHSWSPLTQSVHLTTSVRGALGLQGTLRSTCLGEMIPWMGRRARGVLKI